tara:strand:+ start:357 stop:521 length:165 start_codon:yes stop_codon:yes gene_type:complete
MDETQLQLMIHVFAEELQTQASMLIDVDEATDQDFIKLQRMHDFLTNPASLTVH